MELSKVVVDNFFFFFTFGHLVTCEDIQSLITQLTTDHYSYSKLGYKNLNSFP